MSKDLAISIFEVTSSPLCVASDDGQRVYVRLARALHAGRRVTLSFRNVTTLSTAFVDAAIGQLYGVFTDEEIRSSVKVKDIHPADRFLLKRIVQNAKEYFSDAHGSTYSNCEKRV